MTVSIRKAGYPTLVRSHVRHSGALTPEVTAELGSYFEKRPGIRAGEAADHTFDPLTDPARYLACERQEGYHHSLHGIGTPALADVKAWEQEEDTAYQGLRKEQPSSEAVHIDGPAGVKRKRRRSDEPVETNDIPEADDLEISVIKADKARQLLYGICLEPNQIDSQGDWETPEDIEKAAHRYLGQTFQAGVTDLVNLQHRWDAPGVFPVESYIAPADFVLNGEQVAKGSWVLVMKVADPHTWGEVLDGHWGGFSVEGTGRRDFDQPAPPESRSRGRR